MKKIKFFYLYFLKILVRYKLRFALSILLLGIIIFGISQIRFSLPKPTISQGLVGTFTEDSLPLALTELLSEGLVKIDDQGMPQPSLAQSWSFSEDAKKYTFILKDNLRWSDGTPLKAGDVSIAIPDVTMSATDDKTLVFELVDSYSPFPTLLTRPVFKRGSYIGVGPYRMGRVLKDIVFLKKVELDSIDQSLPDVSMTFYPNEKIARSALKIGEIQSLLGLNEFEDLLTYKPFTLYSKVNYNRLVTIFYNTADPLLADQNIRVALSFAAPAIEDEVEANTPIPPFSWGYNPSTKDYLNNTEGAKQSLKKAEYKDEVITLTATAGLKAVGERIVSQWNSSGINANLRVESGIPQNFQALLIAQNIPSDPDQYSLWHKLGATNISKFAHDRLDKDLEDGRKIADLEKRKQIYSDFQKVLLDHSPATFMYFPKYNVLYLKKIEADLKKVMEIQLVNI